MKNKDTESITLITTSFDSNQDWQFEFPQWNAEKCNNCGICYTVCPDSAIYMNDTEYFEARKVLCKGCGLCAEECPTDCITLKTVGTSPPWVKR